MPLSAFVAGYSKDWSRIDSCSDAWISFPASAIKRTVFLFSSSILCCNNEDSSSILRCNDEDSSFVLQPADALRAVQQHKWPPMRIIRLHKKPTPRTGSRRRDV